MSFDEERVNHLRCVLPFAGEPSELRYLRKTVRQALEQWGAGAVNSDAELVVTELAANVIEHVGEGSPASLVLEPRGGRLRVELHDKSHKVPVVEPVCDEALSGRGLQLLIAMSLDWGTLMTVTGKAVWCELPLGPDRRCAQVQRAAVVLDAYRHLSEARSAPTRAALAVSAANMVADLLHLLVAHGGDPDTVLDHAQTLYEAEAGTPSAAEAVA
ncbi:ATP-binding protein [Streptomyces longispororuber]|uniref:ATP-binding protein n=1 Tax=Streptomyces longispororuber TaxID=68230 RepID=UPI0033F55642